MLRHNNPKIKGTETLPHEAFYRLFLSSMKLSYEYFKLHKDFIKSQCVSACVYIEQTTLILYSENCAYDCKVALYLLHTKLGK